MSADTPPAPAPPNDPLALAELFAGGGEDWLPVLKPVIESQSAAHTFIGPKRGQQVVPVRELTFQALKPNPPHKWKVVVFGQNPYPRAESATGIAMFDNAFGNWADSQFGKVITIRCIIKAAAMWKHKIPKATPIADIRALLKKHDTVQPPGWFQAMLTQGVLLLNAALTASADGALATDQHTAFWRPVVEKVVDHILRAKQSAAASDRGVVFVWWGQHARSLKEVVLRLQRHYPDVKVRHIDHANPAAQGDVFCNGDHFGDVNDALRALGAEPVDWLPSVGWDRPASVAADAPADETAARMGAFITSTMELHKLYLERLQSVKDEGLAELPAITGLLGGPPPSFADAAAGVGTALRGLDDYFRRAQEFAGRRAGGAGAHGLTADEIAAVHLYTCESAFYRQINAALRNPDRAVVAPYHDYLRLLFSAVARLPQRRASLWRGVPLDLRGQYPVGRVVTWWGVSSCTSELGVARAFLGSRGRRTLFEVAPVTAVGIRAFSAFTGEEEFVLAPGTRLKVVDVATERGGLSTIKLAEQAEQRLVA
ncbi:ADP-ribosyltransferase domain-containing protein [Gemmata sp. JC673]|uniref:NAD(+)--protein-arginine ADP-ribosyltransferase n=1 Tax=Gemmata algarum TaxID=2975278 RepID=A0ABU5ETH9_9BACT|nr:ADP-ribosyltransferase domain-containing protein [Gemmata algarum]MDY3557775.1 ADP-ribosyltransferase domain-containing protein [Gemmata algarum]